MTAMIKAVVTAATGRIEGSVKSTEADPEIDLDLEGARRSLVGKEGM